MESEDVEPLPTYRKSTMATFEACDIMSTLSHPMPPHSRSHPQPPFPCAKQNESCRSAGMPSEDGSTIGSLLGRGASSSETPQHAWRRPAQTISACESGTPEVWARKQAPGFDRSSGRYGVEESKREGYGESKSGMDDHDGRGSGSNSGAGTPRGAPYVPPPI